MSQASPTRPTQHPAPPAPRRPRRLLPATLLLALTCVPHPSLHAQTLARPGWAGSGLTVTEWWRNAVVFEVQPTPLQAHPASATPAAPPASQLTDLLDRLDDLQALGADAVLLRGVDRGGPATADGRVSPDFGTLDAFDDLLRQASGRRIRVLVELPPSLDGDALASAARFWLSRGVSGIALAASPTASPAPATPASATDDTHTAAQVALLKGILHGYVGDRVLLVESTTSSPTPNSSTGSRAQTPEMVSVLLHGFVAGQPADVAALRQSLLAARSIAGTRRGGTVASIDAQAGPATGAAAEARASVLLLVSGGVALRTGETGEGPAAQAAAAARAQAASDQAALAAATSPAGISNVKRAIAARAKLEPPRFAGDQVFQWTERMVGLHRGNPVMLLGEQTLLGHDSDGAIVSVWRGRTGEILCEIVNLRATPVEFSLAPEFASMHARGSFLKPLARTDGGMGAMSLAHVHLAPFGVFLGQLGR